VVYTLPAAVITIAAAARAASIDHLRIIDISSHLT
jgi:hypothetical protein